MTQSLTRGLLSDNPRRARSKIFPTSLLKELSGSRSHPKSQCPPNLTSTAAWSPHPTSAAPLTDPAPIAPEMLFGKQALAETLQTGALVMLGTWASRFKLDRSQYCCARVCLLHLHALLAYSSFYLAICLPIHPRRSLCIYSSTCLFVCVHSSVHQRICACPILFV